MKKVKDERTENLLCPIKYLTKVLMFLLNKILNVNELKLDKIFILESKMRKSKLETPDRIKLQK